MCLLFLLYFFNNFINVEFVVFNTKKQKHKLWFLEEVVHKSYDYLHMNLIDL